MNVFFQFKIRGILDTWIDDFIANTRWFLPVHTIYKMNKIQGKFVRFTIQLQHNLTYLYYIFFYYIDWKPWQDPTGFMKLKHVTDVSKPPYKLKSIENHFNGVSIKLCETFKSGLALSLEASKRIANNIYLCSKQFIYTGYLKGCYSWQYLRPLLQDAAVVTAEKLHSMASCQK